MYNFSYFAKFKSSLWVCSGNLKMIILYLHCQEEYQQPRVCRGYHSGQMAECEEELKRLLMRVKEESEKAALKLSIQKTKIMASSPITLWQIDGETIETMTDYFLGLQNDCRW